MIAVVGLARDDGIPATNHDQMSLVGSLLDQVALALERARLESEARDFAALRERDDIRSTLLSTVGDDLTPPLAAIARATRDLSRAGASDKASLSLISGEVSRIQRYVASLLDLGQDTDDKPIEIGPVTIDLFRRAVTRDGAPIRLTPKEYSVLAELAKHRGTSSEPCSSAARGLGSGAGKADRISAGRRERPAPEDRARSEATQNHHQRAGGGLSVGTVTRCQ